MDQDSPPVVIAQAIDEDSGRARLPLFVPQAPRCPKRAPDEILVCAEDPETFRLRPLTQEFTDEALPQARLKLGEGSSIGAEVERTGVGGHVSNRVMIRGRITF
ncbi:MAG: hypothetical protein ACTHLU_07105 [Novosphingobium sp.]